MKVGDRVVCINDKDQLYNVLIEGSDYKVRDINPLTGGLRLEGIILPYDMFHMRIRFRKIEPHTFKNETTAELAKELTEKLKELDRQPEKELA